MASGKCLESEREDAYMKQLTKGRHRTVLKPFIKVKANTLLILDKVQSPTMPHLVSKSALKCHIFISILGMSINLWINSHVTSCSYGDSPSTTRINTEFQVSSKFINEAPVIEVIFFYISKFQKITKVPT